MERNPGRATAVLARSNQARKRTIPICTPTVGVKATNTPMAIPKAIRSGGSHRRGDYAIIGSPVRRTTSE